MADADVPNSMNMLHAKGMWNIARGKLIQCLARLLHDDRKFIKGKEDELIGRIQKRTAQARPKLNRSKLVI